MNTPATDIPALAVIIEKYCIGCTKCIQVCPVDAIVGTTKQMHTVIEEECTGCELCLPPCPVDCIDMLSVKRVSDKPESGIKEHAEMKADRAVLRTNARIKRLERIKEDKAARHATRARMLASSERKKEIKAAVARAKAKKAENAQKFH